MRTSAFRHRVSGATAPTSESVPGTGLPLLGYSAIVLFSIAVFLLWGGPLWAAPRESSHVARFLVSYLIVVPTAALALAYLGRLRVDRLVTTVGTAWAIKLVVTALLYLVVARGTASDVHATAPIASATARPPASAEYSAARAPFKGGAITGTVMRGDAPVAGAAVVVDAPGRGVPLPEPAEVRLAIGADASTVFLARSSDELFATSDGGAAMHTVRLTSAGRFSSNTPLPAGAGAAHIPVPPPGVYDVTCATHAGEHAWLVVVDHPYAVLTDADGRFAIERVPAGARDLTIVASADRTPLPSSTHAHRASKTHARPQEPRGAASRHSPLHRPAPFAREAHAPRRRRGVSSSSLRLVAWHAAC